MNPNSSDFRFAQDEIDDILREFAPSAKKSAEDVAPSPLSDEETASVSKEAEAVHPAEKAADGLTPEGWEEKPPHDFHAAPVPVRSRRPIRPVKLAALILAGFLGAVCLLSLTLRRYDIDYQGEHLLLFSFTRSARRAVEQAGKPLADTDYLVETAVSPMNTQVLVRTEFEVTLTADGETVTRTLPSGATPEEVLAAFGKTLDADDRFSLDGPLYADCSLVLNRVERREETYEEEIPSPIDDQTQPELGTETLEALGRPGLRMVTAWRTYVDGVIESVEEITSETISEPTVTVRYSAQPIRGQGEGVPSDAVEIFIGEATAYCIPGGTTATGKRVQKGYVAVDPRRIPLGTRLYIQSLDGSPDYGYCEAQDTGGAVNGDIVDLYFYSVDECYSWGRRAVRIYVLAD